MSTNRTVLAIVVPCFNEAESIPLFLHTMQEVASNSLRHQELSINYLFINDGSTDKTLDVLREIASNNPEVGYISFSRNFGKEAAIYAGLERAHSFADLICIMDVDLQDPPDLIPKMYHIISSTDVDRVAAYRISRAGEPVLRSFFARMFYRIMNKLTNLEIRNGARDYSLMTKRFVEAVLSCGEYNRFTKGLFGWVGYKTEWLEFENIERRAGETSWSFTGLVRYALEGIMAYSVKPLEIISILGALTSFLAIVFTFVVIIRALLFGDPVAGWPSTMAVILVAGGLIMLSLGFIGQYLAKLYMETKHRPIYLLAEEHNSRDNPRT